MFQIRNTLHELFRGEHFLNTDARKVCDLLEQSLYRFYKAEKANYDKWHDYLDRMEDKLKICHSTWSIMDIDFDMPHDWSDIRYVKTNGWEENPITVEVKGNTWGDLWIASDKALGQCDDKHHVFIEAFYPLNENENTLIMSCGS